MDLWTLFVASIAILLVMGVTWAVAGGAIQQFRLPTLHWTFFNLFMAVALTVLTIRLKPIPFVGLLPSDIALLMAFVALRRGVQVFFGEKTTDREHGIFLLLGLSIVGYMRTVVTAPQMAPGALCMLETYVMLRLVLEGRRGLGPQRKTQLGTLFLMPMGLVALAYAMRAITLFLTPVSESLAGNLTVEVGNVFVVVIVLTMIPVNMALAMGVIGKLISAAERMALHDHLTGLPNRRHIESFLQNEVVRMRRTGTLFAVVMADIDKFKLVNDTHGHAVGDEVLKAVANAMKSASRETDLVGRLGGEEFCAILPATDAAGAERAGERFRQAIEKAVIAVSGKRLPVTSSFGVALCTSKTEDWSALLTRADTALYEAKHTGRNRVCMALDPDVNAAL